ncbi:MAG: hypothetical protein PVJ21_04565 [Anaerolineales bacterium]
MTVKTKLSILSTILIVMIGFLPIPVSASGNLATQSQFLSLDTINTPEEEQTNLPVALRLDDSLAIQITQQPTGNSNFVTPFPNYVTEYQAAANYGTIGLLAHNYLAGQYFSQILLGQDIELVYGDNHIERFIVTEIQRYQALSPNSPSSDFIDLGTGDYLTASQLFNKVYRDQSDHLVLQTCIYADENPNWGRLFIVAEPVS